MRIFAYCRVSTTEQTTENQVIAIRQKGYEVRDSRIVSETVSGSVEAMRREKFKMLINHQMEKGDMLVVLKLDRLGRDNIDVQSTICQWLIFLAQKESLCFKCSQHLQSLSVIGLERGLEKDLNERKLMEKSLEDL
mgnify:CR=1 FL=1